MAARQLWQAAAKLCTKRFHDIALIILAAYVNFLRVLRDSACLSGRIWA